MALLTQRAAVGQPPSIGVAVFPCHKDLCSTAQPRSDTVSLRPYSDRRSANFPNCLPKVPPLFQGEHEVVLNVLASLATTCNVANGVVAVGVGLR